MYLRIIAAVIIIAFIGIQFIQIDRTNPRIMGEIETPAPVKEILRRACYDCHSNETMWPWYSYIAPASWLVESDVNGGRKELNFSEWGGYNEQRKQKKIKKIWEEVNEGEMPEWYYALFHREAKLTDADKRVLRDWTAAGGK